MPQQIAKTPTRPPQTAGCSAMCRYRGKSGSCGFRIQWGANHRYLGQPQACKKAWIMVLSQCPVCSQCALANAGCVAQAPPPSTTSAPPLALSSVPFDCLVGFAHWQHDWSDEKRKWCCRHTSRGCSAKTSSVPYDCLEGFSNWQQGWSADKKRWCCNHRQHGCEEESVPPVQFDCLAGWSTWRTGWSANKKTWCCQKYGRGCPEITTMTSTSKPHEYDCKAGLSNWLMGWSIEKKDWCCKMEHVHCAPKDFNCHAGLYHWKEAWSVEKKEWCCKHEEVHCSDGVAGPRPQGKFGRVALEQPAPVPCTWRTLAALPSFGLALLALLGVACQVRGRAAERGGQRALLSRRSSASKSGTAFEPVPAEGAHE